MTYSFDITETQCQNLLTLADYLDQLPEDCDKFDMAFYNSSYAKPSPYTICGSVACAIGHGPAAGIIPEIADTTWHRYSLRAFTGQSPTLWDWCFSAIWRSVDNTPQGAAKRIRWALEHGVPDNYVAQMFSGAPLCYTQPLNSES